MFRIFAPSVYKEVLCAKNIERKILLQALQEQASVFSTIIFQTKVELIEARNKAFFHECEKIYKHYNVSIRDGKIFDTNNESSYRRNDTIGISIEQRVQEMQKRINSLFTIEANFQESIQKFDENVIQLRCMLLKSGNIGVSRRYIKAILKNIHRALSCSCYQLLKFDEKHPSVCFLHNVIFALFTHMNLQEPFKKIAEILNIGQRTKEEDFNSAYVNTFYIQAKRKGLFTHNSSPHYIITFLRNCIGAFVSTVFGQFFKVPYSSLHHVENIPGSYYEQKITDTLSFHSMYTGSPTKGNYLSMEAHALLQAIENRHFMTKEEYEENQFPYLKWSYVNLQNISCISEHDRSIALMQIQSYYPFSFHACTITQDSEFFTERSADQYNICSFDKSYVHEMKQHLIHTDNLSLINRTVNKGGEYYFPHLYCSKEKWEQYIDSILEYGFTLISKKSHADKVKRTAFRELVHLGIIYLWHVLDAKELMKEHSNGYILISQVCKECIDRGGRIQAELAWALGLDEQQVLQALYSRALLTRYRLILRRRLEPFLNLIDVVEQKECIYFLTEYIPQLVGMRLVAQAEAKKA